ncbi:MAG TPA: hypothetical protein VFD03_10050 [Clostridia bacterium]|nr:hypothetical protein [Clostridia bacterium]
MNCCNNNKNDSTDKNNNAHKGHMSHMWMMALCCGAPIILLLIISLLGASFSGIRGSLLGFLPFICPIMMVFMIPMMFRKGKDSGDCHKENQNETTIKVKDSENKQLN